jgi:hypothetical protein
MPDPPCSNQEIRYIDPVIARVAIGININIVIINNARYFSDVLAGKLR